MFEILFTIKKIKIKMKNVAYWFPPVFRVHEINISKKFTPLSIKFVFRRIGFLFYPNFAII